MRRALTAPELALLDTHPHVVKMHLAVFKPTILFAAQVDNDDIEHGERSITYDNITKGTYADIIPGHTLWIGTEPGLYDLGRVRIKDRSESFRRITVAENADVQWQDNAYLSVIDPFEFWAVYPRIVADGDWLEFYQDYDQPLVGDDLDPIAIMGPPACAFIEPSTGLANVKFVGEYSYPQTTGTTVTSYSWTFTGTVEALYPAVTDAGTVEDPVVRTYNAPGIYRASLEVGDSDDHYHTGRRPVFIFNRTGANAPYSQIQIKSLDGDTEGGGWTTTLQVFGDASLTDFPDRAMVVLFAEEWFGDTQQSIGGYPYRENIKFVGYIDEETTSVNWTPEGARYVEFHASTIDAQLKAAEMFALTVEYDDTPADYVHVAALSTTRTAYWLLKFHSTLYDICDVNYLDDHRRIKGQDFAQGPLWSQLTDFLSSASALAIVDKQGCLHLERDVQLTLSDDRDDIIDILKVNDRLRERLDIPRRVISQCNYIEVSGVWYNYRTDTAKAYIAEAPGRCPRQEGHEERIEHLIFNDSQSDANELAGLYLASRNNPYVDLTMRLRGNHSYLDIAPQAWLLHDLTADSNKRGLYWSNKRFVPRSVSIEYDPEKFTLETEITVDAESTGPDGITCQCPPDEQPEEDPSGDEDPPNPPPPPPEPPVSTWQGKAIIGTYGRGVYRTLNGGELWAEFNEGLYTQTSGSYTGPAIDGPGVVGRVIHDPWGVEKTGSLNILWAATWGGLYRRVGDAAWSRIEIPDEAIAYPSGEEPPTYDSVRWVDIVGDICTSGRFFALGWYMTARETQDPYEHVLLAVTEDDGENWKTMWVPCTWTDSEGWIYPIRIYNQSSFQTDVGPVFHYPGPWWDCRGYFELVGGQLQFDESGFNPTPYTWQFETQALQNPAPMPDLYPEQNLVATFEFFPPVYADPTFNGVLPCQVLAGTQAGRLNYLEMAWSVPESEFEYVRPWDGSAPMPEGWTGMGSTYWLPYSSMPAGAAEAEYDWRVPTNTYGNPINGITVGSQAASSVTVTHWGSVNAKSYDWEDSSANIGHIKIGGVRLKGIIAGAPMQPIALDVDKETGDRVFLTTTVILPDGFLTYFFVYDCSLGEYPDKVYQNDITAIVAGCAPFVPYPERSFGFIYGVPQLDYDLETGIWGTPYPPFFYFAEAEYEGMTPGTLYYAWGQVSAAAGLGAAHWFDSATHNILDQILFVNPMDPAPPGGVDHSILGSYRSVDGFVTPGSLRELPWTSDCVGAGPPGLRGGFWHTGSRFPYDPNSMLFVNQSTAEEYIRCALTQDGGVAWLDRSVGLPTDTAMTCVELNWMT